MMIDTEGDSTAISASSNLMVSTIDGNVEQTEAPDTVTTAAPKIRISGAIGGMVIKLGGSKSKDSSGAGDKEKTSSTVDDDVIAEDVVSAIPVIGGGVAPITTNTTDIISTDNNNANKKQMDNNSTSTGDPETNEDNDAGEKEPRTGDCSPKATENGMLLDEGKNFFILMKFYFLLITACVCETLLTWVLVIVLSN